MKFISYLYLFIATIIWSFAPPLVKLVLNDIDPIFFLFVRFGIVTILCLPFIYNFLKNKKYSSYDWANVILYAVTGQVVLIIFFIGLDLTTATDAIIIVLIGPIATIAAGHYFFRDKVNLMREIGIVIAFLGAILVIAEPLLSSTNGTAKNRFLGNLLISSNLIIGTFWVIYSKFLFGTNSTKFIQLMKKIGVSLKKKKYDETEFNILSFLIAFIATLPFYFVNFQNFNQNIMNLSATSLGVILYMAIFSSILAYILYTKAQAKLEVSEVSVLSYVSPFFSLPAAYYILKELPSNYSILGLIVIFIGIFIAEKYKKG